MAATGKSYNLSVVVEAIDKITGPLKRVNAAVSATAGRISGIGNSLRTIGDRGGLPTLLNAFGKVGSAAAAVGKRVALLGAGIVTFAAAGVAALIPLAKAYADATGAIGDTANRTGISRERLQELGYAAQLSGSSAETLAAALGKMNLAVGAATKGSKEFKDMFAGLQINLKNADGTFKSTDEQFDIFVNRISRIKDPALQAQAAVKIFGKSAIELLPLIRSGNKGIAEMSTEARRLGVVLSEDAVGAGEDFGDTLDKLSFAFKGVSNTVLSALVPTLNKLATQLIEIFVKYRPQIEAFAEAFAKNLPGYIETVWQNLQRIYNLLKPLGELLVWMSGNLDGISIAFDVLAGVMIAAVLPSIIALTTAFWSLAAAVLATPIGWIALAAAAFVAAAVLIYKNWDEFASFFIDKFEKVKTAFGEGFVKGLWNLWKEFNPTSLIIDSLNSLVKFATGIDIAGILKEKLGIVSGDVEVNATGGAGTGGNAGGNPNYTAVPEGGPIATALADAKANITLDFKSLPQGTSVDTSAGQGVKVQTNQGYSMMAAGT